QLGRAFNPEDHSPGIIPEVVISHALWKRAFGSDPNILGKNVRMDTDLYQIVGVMPARFDAPGRMAEERNVEIWTASSFYGARMRNGDSPGARRRSRPPDSSNADRKSAAFCAGRNGRHRVSFSRAGFFGGTRPGRFAAPE